MQQSFMVKVLEHIGLEGTCPNILKTMYENPTTNINLNGEKLDTISLKSGMRQGVYYPYSFSMCSMYSLEQ